MVEIYRPIQHVSFFPTGYDDETIRKAVALYLAGEPEKVLNYWDYRPDGVLNFEVRPHYADDYAIPLTPAVIIARSVAFFTHIIHKSLVDIPSYQEVASFAHNIRLEAGLHAAYVHEQLDSLSVIWGQSNLDARREIVIEAYRIISCITGCSQLPLIINGGHEGTAYFHHADFLDPEDKTESSVELSLMTLYKPFSDVLNDISHELRHAHQQARIISLMASTAHMEEVPITDLISDISRAGTVYVKPPEKFIGNMHIDHAYKWQLCELEARCYAERFAEFWSERERASSTIQLLRP